MATIPIPRYFGRATKLWKPTALSKFEHTHSFTGAEFNMHRKPAVYVWKRGEKWLYIGSTYHGMHRLCDAKHEILSKYKVEDTDEILIMYNLSRYQARNLEAKLIREHKPKYNKWRKPVEGTRNVLKSGQPDSRLQV